MWAIHQLRCLPSCGQRSVWNKCQSHLCDTIFLEISLPPAPPPPPPPLPLAADSAAMGWAEGAPHPHDREGGGAGGEGENEDIIKSSVVWVKISLVTPTVERSVCKGTRDAQSRPKSR
jgi:hypothetical protein